MNRSYSKIRHIQQCNLWLENKLINEQNNTYSWQSSDTGLTPVYNQDTGKSTNPNVSQVGRTSKSDDYMAQSYVNPRDADHVLLSVLAIGTAFLGPIGLFISAGISLGDAKLYYDDGDTYMAGLTAMFALIPGSAVLKKLIPSVSKLSPLALNNLIKKLDIFKKTGKKPIFDAVESEVLGQVSKNSDEISKATSQVASQAAETTINQTIKNSLMAIAKTGLNIVKPVATYGSAAMGYDVAYNMVQQNTPSTIVSAEGFDWGKVKYMFGSSGSENDNKLLYSAWQEGWRPGTVVPEKYQTPGYKKLYKEEGDGIKQLEAMVATIKTQKNV